MASVASRKALRQLNDAHTEIVFKYLRFAVLQRNDQLKDMQTNISDFKESRIHSDETYSSDEVLGLLDSLGETVRADMLRDLQRVSHSNVVLLQQVLGQAEDANVDVTVDTSKLEDEMLLAFAANLEVESEKPRESELPAALTTKTSMKQMALPSLNAHKQSESLEIERAQLKLRLAELQKELVEVNRQKTEVKSSLLKCQDTLKSITQYAEAKPFQAAIQAIIEGHTGEAESLELAGREAEAAASAVCTELREEVESLKTQLAAAKEEEEMLQAALHGRLDQAPQFRSMKEMMLKKNDQIKVLREQLVAFGWTDPDA